MLHQEATFDRAEAVDARVTDLLQQALQVGIRGAPQATQAMAVVETTAYTEEETTEVSQMPA